MAEPKPDTRLNVANDVAAVPTFACIVYVTKTDEGTRARVANLPDLQCIATTERDALGKIVPEFKQRISQWLAAGQQIPWIDPPSAQEPDEQKRFVPVHL